MQPADSRQSITVTTKIVLGSIMSIAYLSAGFLLFFFPEKLPDKPLWVGRTVGGLLFFYAFFRGYKTIKHFQSLRNNGIHDENQF